MPECLMRSLVPSQACDRRGCPLKDRDGAACKKDCERVSDMTEAAVEAHLTVVRAEQAIRVVDTKTAREMRSTPSCAPSTPRSAFSELTQ